MSALGHKRTFCDARAMSALPPIADMCSALTHVRFVPIADIGTKCASLRIAGKIKRVGKPPMEHTKRSLALTKCPAKAAIGPAPRNLNSLQAPPEEFGLP
jgi:hypothetical protein